MPASRELDGVAVGLTETIQCLAALDGFRFRSCRSHRRIPGPAAVGTQGDTRHHDQTSTVHTTFIEFEHVRCLKCHGRIWQHFWGRECDTLFLKVLPNECGSSDRPDTKEIAGPTAVETVRNAKRIGQEQFLASFTKECLVESYSAVPNWGVWAKGSSRLSLSSMIWESSHASTSIVRQGIGTLSSFSVTRIRRVLQLSLIEEGSS